MFQRDALELLVGRHSFVDHVIGAFDKDLDLAAGRAHDDGHALACARELDDVEDVVHLVRAENVDGDLLRSARREDEPCSKRGKGFR